MQLMHALQQHFEKVDPNCPLKAVRLQAWERFQTLGLPATKQEAFQYVPLRELLESTFEMVPSAQVEKAEIQAHLLPECRHSHLVFVDGEFSENLSDLSHFSSSALLFPLSRAMRSHGHYLQNHFARAVKEEVDPFALLNLSLHSKGAYLYLPPESQAEAPLQCLFFYTSLGKKLLSPRLHLIMGKRSKAEVITTVATRETLLSPLVIPSLEFALEESAHLSFYNLSETPSSWQFDTIRASLKREANFCAFQLHAGAKVERQSYRIFLREEGASATLNGLSLLKGRDTAHTHVHIEHQAPNTRSSQLFKGILKEYARSSFEGKIYVHPEAQKTEAYQLNRHLLLNQGTIANSKPNLEIFADDVKASHGATVSQIDPKQLFYLKTRGIDEAAARALLIHAFCQEVLEKLPHGFLREKLQEQMHSYLTEKQVNDERAL